MAEILYYIGDATKPVKEPALICHVCNTIGGWGAGFVLALSKKSPVPEAAYRAWAKETNNNLPLGQVQFVSLPGGNFVCNMIAQKGIRPENGVPPIRYDALEDALYMATDFAKTNDLVIAMPRIGAKLAGGDWAKIEQIIEDSVNVDCYVYTLPSETNDWPNTTYKNQAAHSDDIDLNTVFN